MGIIKNNWIHLLQRFAKNPTNVHTEAYYRDDLWTEIKKKFGKGYTWFLLTPTNYDYCKAYFNLKLTKQEFTQKLIERIKEFKENNEKIELHIHLCNKKEFLDNELQDIKFKEAMDFLTSLEIEITEFAPGWYTYNDYTLTMLKEYGIKSLYEFDHNPRKKSYVKNGITIKYDYRVYHDYDFRKK